MPENATLSDSPRLVEVVLPLPFGHGFDYRVPDGMDVAVGDYVFVPFGKREAVGVVWGSGKGDAPPAKLKAIARRADGPPMSETLRQTLAWVADYTLSPLGMVLKMALSVPEALTPPKRAVAHKEPSTSIPCPAHLSPEQHTAAYALRLGLGRYGVTLLDGVTGSGKTEVYFDTIAAVLENGGQALVMLPEIALSSQWLGRFKARFGFEPAVWHSGIGKAAKKRAWLGVRDGSVPVVVGARSALFLPFARLALIVVDEEHDASYKQEEGILYHARDMAVVRAHHEGIPVLLASATPSLETWVNTQEGRYERLHLPDRHGAARLPTVERIDLRVSAPERGLWLSPPLRDAVLETLARGEQSLLFLNRRGYAPLVLCRACGHRFECPNCTAWLVLHRRLKILQCHHCGFVASEPDVCPSCQHAQSLVPCGPGVERVTEEARALFPSARIAVMASDMIGGPGEAQALVEAMERGEVDILVGTQMTAKGHHFPHLTLVGVVDADLGMGGGDLRAAERTYQLLHQVAGRAGRGERPGRVLLQTYLPDHPVMEALVRFDRDRFLDCEAHYRQLADMPPFGRLAAVIVSAADQGVAEKAANLLAARAPHGDGIVTLGPAPAPIFMLRNQFRYRFLVKGRRGARLQGPLRAWLSAVSIPSSVTCRVDIDPQSFL